MKFGELRRLIAQRENPTLDFKQEWYKYKRFKTGEEGYKCERGEMIKDIPSLGNGKSIVADEPAYLVF